MEHEETADLIRCQLRRQRSLTSLSQEDFGRRMNYSASTVSAVETGTRAMDLPFAKRADEVLETGGLFVSLLRAAQRDGQPSWFRPWLDAERVATQLRLFELALVPGLLQTENYARAVLRLNDTLSSQDVEERVASRLERQKILTREAAPQVVIVLDQAALTRLDEEVAGIMAEQIAHIAALTELPNVHIHVIPSTTALHIGLSGPFALARSADGAWVGHLENQLGGVVVAQEDGVATLLARWECVRNETLPRRQSIDLIKEVQSQHGPH
ncbi:helix-turn-helix domain-containing protein [Micromonospora antibiotica]|uniref:Helix-turn-helix transcriptional regulator n=1 Tax=Micromonospora antibiotica TaxID=2807623 RepID=A0ABS3VG37_9ACTN|nr:helix-turn-helix transcriptional regulator [Micromonospora antibiotica]MBO4164599.1 helix-turn-helix transcriptional regulator [Micromonospora antibiotica]